MFRYIQASYIAMMNKQAYEKAKKEAEAQVLRAFFATEELRKEVQRKQGEARVRASMKLLRQCVEVMETKLVPLLSVLLPASIKLESVAASLEKVKHNLLVQVWHLVVTVVLKLMFMLVVGSRYSQSRGGTPSPGYFDWNIREIYPRHP